MSDVRLTATDPSDSSVVPVACNARGELLTVAPVIEKIPNDVEIEGNLIVNGTITSQTPSLVLPPDPYEGALLGWLNGGLAWVGAPPVPIPDGVFGPITAWDSQNGYLEVEGDIPASVLNGVYIYQCNQDGSYFTAGWDTAKEWSDNCTTNDAFNPSNTAESAFNGRESGAGSAAEVQTAGSSIYIQVANLGFTDTNVVRIKGRWSEIEINGNPQGTGTVNGAYREFNGVRNLDTIKLYGSDASSFSPLLYQIEVGTLPLVDSSASLNLRVNSVIGNGIVGVGSVVRDFTVGKYLYVPAQRVAPWVLYGNDPTSLIDHLRPS